MEGVLDLSDHISVVYCASVTGQSRKVDEEVTTGASTIILKIESLNFNVNSSCGGVWSMSIPKLDDFRYFISFQAVLQILVNCVYL